jgi:segregation and condensation protein A
MTEAPKGKGRGARGGDRQAELDSELPLSLIPNPYTIDLPEFAGPLDLLLNLIREHKLDIFNIPISFVADKFLEYIETMKHLNLDVAGEHLRMAATLAYIKSRMMLPIAEGEGDEEEKDPRAELVERLLTFQQFKDASAALAGRTLLGRDIFARSSRELAEFPAGEAPLVEVSVFHLLKAFMGIQRKLKTPITEEITPERITIAQRIFELVELLAAVPERPFFELLGGAETARDVIVTFISILEMAKLKMIRVFQVEKDGEIYVKSLILQEEVEDKKLEISRIEYR